MPMSPPKKSFAPLEVTRGALYHHFSGKSDLFLAVFEDVQREIAERIEQAAQSEPDLWLDFWPAAELFWKLVLILISANRVY